VVVGRQGPVEAEAAMLPEAKQRLTFRSLEKRRTGSTRFGGARSTGCGVVLVFLRKAQHVLRGLCGVFTLEAISAQEG